MKISFDCRDILAADPCQHAGVYDLLFDEAVYASIGGDTENIKCWPSGATKRWVAGYNFCNSIDEINRMFGNCFMSAIGDHEKLPKISVASKMQGELFRMKRKKPKSLLMHIKTWNQIQLGFLKNETFWSYKEPWRKFQKWIYGLNVVVLNDYIIPGVVIGLDYPEEIGIITYNGVWLNPIGLGITGKRITAVFLEGNYADI